MQQQCLGLSVLGQIIHEIIQIHVNTIPQGHQMGEAHLPVQGPVHHRTCHRAGLADIGNLARQHPHVQVGGIDVPVRTHEAHRIGAQHPHPVARCNVPDGIHQWPAAAAVRPGQPPGKNHAGPHLVLAQLVHHLGHRLRRRTDNGQIRHKRQMMYPCITGDAVHLIVFLVHHRQAPLVIRGHQVAKNHPAKVGGPFGCPENHDGLGVEEAVQMSRAHNRVPWSDEVRPAYPTQVEGQRP